MKFGEQVYYEPVKSGLKVKSDQKHILDTASFELLVVNQQHNNLIRHKF